MSQRTPPGSKFNSLFPTPPDENQPLDFSAKRLRLSTDSPPVSPSTTFSTPSTPILTIPCPPVRKLHQDHNHPDLHLPQISLPDTPLPIPLLEQNFRNALVSQHSNLVSQQPDFISQNSMVSQQPSYPSSSQTSGTLPLAMSPFLLGGGLCFPSLFQSMVGANLQRPPQPSPVQTLSPPATPSVPHEKTELLKVNSDSLGHYAAFRHNMLKQLSQKKSLYRRDSSDSSDPGNLDPGMGRVPQPDSKDQAYWERRRKNNLAAKRSRDARRAKEDEIAIRAAFLEQENVQLKWEVARLKSETSRLRTLLLADSDNEEGGPHQT